MLYHFDKALDRKGIMLGGDAELLFQISVFAVFFKQIIILRQHLARIANELQAVVCRRDASAAAVKDRDTQLLFKLLQGRRQRRLCDI